MKQKIKVGDLLYDADRKVYGIIEEKLDHPYPWIVAWTDGRKNWVDTATIEMWKRELHELRTRNSEL
jgi:hypothetical protein